MSDTPIIRYGGKGAMAHLIYPHFVATTLYAEPFFGGGGMFFQIPRGNWRSCVVNDLEDRLINFFTQLRDNHQQLIEKCELSPFARQEFLNCREKADDPLEDARRFFVISTQAFSGNYNTTGWRCLSPDSDSHTMVRNKVAGLSEFVSRIKGTAIEHQDAASFVRQYARPGVFFYSDPPYVTSSRIDKNVYTCEMTDEQHRDLAAAHNEATMEGAKICISGYNSPLYEELYRGWRTIDIEVPVSASNSQLVDRAKRVERLWLNYGPEEEMGARVHVQKYKPKTARERALLKALR